MPPKKLVNIAELGKRRACSTSTATATATGDNALKKPPVNISEIGKGVKPSADGGDDEVPSKTLIIHERAREVSPTHGADKNVQVLPETVKLTNKNEDHHDDNKKKQAQASREDIDIAEAPSSEKVKGPNKAQIGHIKNIVGRRPSKGISKPEPEPTTKILVSTSLLKNPPPTATSQNRNEYDVKPASRDSIYSIDTEMAVASVQAIPNKDTSTKKIMVKISELRNRGNSSNNGSLARPREAPDQDMKSATAIATAVVEKEDGTKKAPSVNIASLRKLGKADAPDESEKTPSPSSYQMKRMGSGDLKKRDTRPTRNIEEMSSKEPKSSIKEDLDAYGSNQSLHVFPALHRGGTEEEATSSESKGIQEDENQESSSSIPDDKNPKTDISNRVKANTGALLGVKPTRNDDEASDSKEAKTTTLSISPGVDVDENGRTAVVSAFSSDEPRRPEPSRPKPRQPPAARVPPPHVDEQSDSLPGASRVPGTDNDNDTIVTADDWVAENIVHAVLVEPSGIDLEDPSARAEQAAAAAHVLITSSSSSPCPTPSPTATPTPTAVYEAQRVNLFDKRSVCFILAMVIFVAAATAAVFSLVSR